MTTPINTLDDPGDRDYFTLHRLHQRHQRHDNGDPWATTRTPIINNVNPSARHRHLFPHLHRTPIDNAYQALT